MMAVTLNGTGDRPWNGRVRIAFAMRRTNSDNDHQQDIDAVKREKRNEWPEKAEVNRYI